METKKKEEAQEKAAPDFDPKKYYSMIATASCKTSKEGTKTKIDGAAAKVLYDRGWFDIDNTEKQEEQ